MIEWGRSRRACAWWGGALLALSSLACASLTHGDTNYLTGFQALPEPGFIHVVVEVPAGTDEKWEVSEDGRQLQWEQEGGVGRVVRYLAYPANYGMVPRTRLTREAGGDGDPLDVLVLGASIARGTVLLARPIGVLRLFDDGEQDDKVIAVPTSGALADVRDLAALERELPGALGILETWFLNYKGVGRTELRDTAGAEAALQVIRAASESFEQASDADPARRSHTAAH